MHMTTSNVLHADIMNMINMQKTDIHPIYSVYTNIYQHATYSIHHRNDQESLQRRDEEGQISKQHRTKRDMYRRTDEVRLETDQKKQEAILTSWF